MKGSKKYSLIALLFLYSCSNNNDKYAKYDVISASNKDIVFFDDFISLDNWVGNKSDVFKFKILNKNLLLFSEKIKADEYIYLEDLLGGNYLDTLTNFEIELLFFTNSENLYFKISNGYIFFFGFYLNNSNCWLIGYLDKIEESKTEYGSIQKKYFQKSQFKRISKKDVLGQSHILTLRKVNNRIYYFCDGQFLISCDLKPELKSKYNRLYISLYDGTIEVDYFKISKINFTDPSFEISHINDNAKKDMVETTISESINEQEKNNRQHLKSEAKETPQKEKTTLDKIVAFIQHNPIAIIIVFIAAILGIIQFFRKR
jgi:hypothetical protein